MQSRLIHFPVNDARATRVADLLSDFRALQHRIASITCDSLHPDDFYTEGYAALRQCSVDGQHVLNVAADTRVPTGRGGQAEQEKAELTQVLLDSFSRRHEAQKICMRQSAAMRWVAWRDGVLLGMRPDPSHVPALVSCDQALRAVRSSFLLHCPTLLSSSNWRISEWGHYDRNEDIMLTRGNKQELATVTDDNIYNLMRNSDFTMGRWTDEDPSLRNVQRWLRSRR